MARFVKAKLLTPENFRRYGTIIEKPFRKPDVEREFLNYWNDLYDLDFDEAATLGCLELRRQAFTVNDLERHVKGPEIFIPLGGVGLMPFAPASDMKDPNAQPDIDKMEVFLLDGTKGFVINKGIWHFPPLPVTEYMTFILTVPKKVSDDLDIKHIELTEICL